MIFLKEIHSLTAVHRMAIRGRQRICDILLTPKPVAAVLRLAVNAVARNAIRAFLFHQWDVIPSGSISRRHGWRYLVRSGISAVDAVIFIHQRLMPMLLCPKSTGFVHCTCHGFSTLVVQAQDARHHVGTALRCLERRGAFLLVSNPSGLCPLTCRKRRRMGQTVRFLPFASLRNKGLLLHSRTGAQRTGQVMQVPRLIPLVDGKSAGGNDPIAAGRHSAVCTQCGSHRAC